MRYSYAAEKFAAARRCLMLPHSRGEAASIADAFHECHLGLHELDRAELDDSADSWLRKLDALMDVSELASQGDGGQWQQKAETFTTDQKLELSILIDELAYWFSDKNREGD